MLSRLCDRAAAAAKQTILVCVLASLPSFASAAMPSGHIYAFDRGPSGGVTEAAFPKWTGAMTRNWAHNGPTGDVCAKKMRRSCDIGRWQQFLADTEAMDPMRKLRRVNAFINQTTYRHDHSVWGRSDYWAAPGEFFARGGDCEDYAIAKYYSLRSIGFSAKNMRIVVLKDTSRNLLHAVLVVKHGGNSFVLDNLSRRVLDWKDMKHYKPLYSVNEDSYWLHPGLRKI